MSSERRCSSKQTFKDCDISTILTWGGEFEFTMGAFYRFVSSERRCSSKRKLSLYCYISNFNVGILIHHGGWWSRISPLERSYRFVSSERRCSSKQTFKDCHISNFNVVNFSSTWDVFEFEFNHKRGGEFEFTMGAFYRFVSSESRCSSKANLQQLLFFEFQRGDFNSPWGVMKSNSPWERSYRFVSSERRCSSKQTFKDCYISNVNVGWWIRIHHGSVLPVCVVWAPVFLKANLPTISTWGGDFKFTMGASYGFVSSERLVLLESKLSKQLLYFEFQRGDFNSPWGVMNSNSPWERSYRFVLSERRCSSKLTFKDCHISNFNVVNFSSTWDVFEFEFNHKRGGEFEFTMGAFYRFVSSERRCSSKRKLSKIVIFQISTWGF